MLHTVQGLFRDGKLELHEPAPQREARVLVTFLPNDQSGEMPAQAVTSRPLGFAEGQVVLHPSFFEPLPEELLAAFEGKIE